jgi:hypothetical protein
MKPNPAFVPAPPFTSELCNLQPEEKKGSSAFDVKGPCTFHVTTNVKCSAVVDDFYTSVLRKGPGEATA